MIPAGEPPDPRAPGPPAGEEPLSERGETAAEAAEELQPQAPGAPPERRDSFAELEALYEAEEEADEEEEDEGDEEIERRSAALLSDRRRLVLLAAGFVLSVVAIYLVFPKIVGLDGAFERIGDATWYWIVVALILNVGAFAAYVALFFGVLGGSTSDPIRLRLDMRASYQITMAGLAATRVFSAAGAGGLVVTYWALRKAGMRRRMAARRMLAFLILLYAVYLVALLLFGILLRTGVLPGEAPFAGTVIPAIVSGVIIAVLLLVSLIPEDVERRVEERLAQSVEEGRGRVSRALQRIASVPATTASGVRMAIAFVREPRRGALAVGGAVGFWAANIAVLWASFEAFGGDVPFAVLVQGFFLGMVANLLPSPAGGVGNVDAGMIGAFAIFGVAGSVVFPAVLTYRVIAFWLPIPPGIVAFVQLRATVARWEAQRKRLGYTSQSKVMDAIEAKDLAPEALEAK